FGRDASAGCVSNGTVRLGLQCRRDACLHRRKAAYRITPISATGTNFDFCFGASTSRERKTARADCRSKRTVFAFRKLVGRKSVGARGVGHAAREWGARARARKSAFIGLRRDRLRLRSPETGRHL